MRRRWRTGFLSSNTRKLKSSSPHLNLLELIIDMCIVFLVSFNACMLEINCLHILAAVFIFWLCCLKKLFVYILQHDFWRILPHYSDIQKVDLGAEEVDWGKLRHVEFGGKEEQTPEQGVKLKHVEIEPEQATVTLKKLQEPDQVCAPFCFLSLCRICFSFFYNPIHPKSTCLWQYPSIFPCQFLRLQHNNLRNELPLYVFSLQ